MRSVNPTDYYHPQDRATLDNLQRIPGFATALKAFMKLFDEKMMHGVNMASKIRLGPDQLGHIYSLLPPICEVLGIKEPEFYLEMNPAPNAYTMGDSLISITITSGLLEYMEEDELKAVIAHECGHIACRHSLYHTMAGYILQGGGDLLGLGALLIPLKLAFFHWQRCSEFSCDRAAAIYMRGASSVMETMVRLAGGKAELTGKVNMALYAQQAAEYEKLVSDSAWDKTLQFLALMNSSHPFLSVRSAEISKWCDGESFKSILRYMDGESGKTCPSCGAEGESGWKFCKRCGTAL